MRAAVGPGEHRQGDGDGQLLALDVDDYVFYRPIQSESVMLQFGDLALVRGGRIVYFWPVFEERG